MSIAKGKGNQKHNTREQKERPINVDHERTKDNIVICNYEIHEAYNKLFKDVLEEYNAKQKRADRKIKDYYKHISNSKREKTFHELVVQIGDKYKHPDNSTSISIYKQFVEEFKKNNPQMPVIGAYIHLDEATPHLHLDYIPIATEQKRGLRNRVSNDLAIKQQGYKNWENWKDTQFKTLELIAEEHNITREYQYNTEKHRTVDGYKKEQEIIKTKIKHLENEIGQSDVSPKRSILGKETVDYEKYKALEQAYKLQKAQNSVLSEENKKLEDKYLKIKNKRYIEENRALTKELNEVKQENRQLAHENNNLKKENIKLTKENERLEFAKDILLTLIDKLHLRNFYEKVLEKIFIEKTSLEEISNEEYLNGINDAKQSLERETEEMEYYHGTYNPKGGGGSIKDRIKEAKEAVKNQNRQNLKDYRSYDDHDLER